MARTSNLRNRSVAGPTRESKISFLIQAGFTNRAILRALEEDWGEYIPADDPRRDPKSKHYIEGLPPFDATARQRAQEAIRSTRKQDSDATAATDHIIAAFGGEGKVKPLSESKLENLERFPTGFPAFDHIYGSTKYVHLDDDPQLRWRKGDPMIPDAKGGWVRTRIRTGQMEKVILKAGEAPVEREKLILVPDLDLKRQKTEWGMPVSFQSIWAGSPGVGKSRLAIALTKSLNRVDRLIADRTGVIPRPVLYLNGEAPEAQFRLWSGADIDPELFLAYHSMATEGSSPIIRLNSIIDFIYEYKPRAVIIDSIQMVAEAKKGTKGAEAVMIRLNEVKADPEAGRPHLILVSQLNKQEEVAGSRSYEYLADFVGKATHYRRDGTFLFDCPEKNRGGPTPRGAIFNHTDHGPVCISTERKGSNFLKLVQPTAPVPLAPALGAAISEADEFDVPPI
jgi:hypothetical protein